MLILQNITLNRLHTRLSYKNLETEQSAFQQNLEWFVRKHVQALSNVTNLLRFPDVSCNSTVIQLLFQDDLSVFKVKASRWVKSYGKRTQISCRLRLNVAHSYFNEGINKWNGVVITKKPHQIYTRSLHTNNLIVVVGVNARFGFMWPYVCLHVK